MLCSVNLIKAKQSTKRCDHLPFLAFTFAKCSSIYHITSRAYSCCVTKAEPSAIAFEIVKCVEASPYHLLKVFDQYVSTGSNMRIAFRERYTFFKGEGRDLWEVYLRAVHRGLR